MKKVLPLFFVATILQAQPLPNLIFMEPIGKSGPCLDSLIGEPNEAYDCTPWARQDNVTPAVDTARGLVYAGGRGEKLRVFSARTGKLLREFKIHGNLAAKPVFDKAGYLYFGTLKGDLYKFDPFAFKILWEKKLTEEIQSEAHFDDGAQVFFAYGLGGVAAYDLKTGVENWRYEPSVAPVLAISGSRTLHFRGKNPQSSDSKPVVVLGQADGTLLYLDAKTGESLKIESFGNKDLPFPDITAGPIFSDDLLIFAAFNVGIFAVEPKSGMKLWEYPLTGVSEIAYKNGVLYAGLKKKVVAIDMSRGKLLWEFSLQKGAPTNIVIDQNLLYVASKFGPIYVLNKVSGRPLKSLGSRLGFAGKLTRGDRTFFAISTPGFLYALSPDFAGQVR